MAQLTERAEASRNESQRLRAEAHRLRDDLHSIVRCQQTAVAHASIWLSRVADARARPLPSAWSGLEWRQPDQDLDGVLVVHE